MELHTFISIRHWYADDVEKGISFTKAYVIYNILNENVNCSFCIITLIFVCVPVNYRGLPEGFNLDTYHVNCVEPGMSDWPEVVQIVIQ